MFTFSKNEIAKSAGFITKGGEFVMANQDISFYTTFCSNDSQIENLFKAQDDIILFKKFLQKKLQITKHFSKFNLSTI